MHRRHFLFSLAGSTLLRAADTKGFAGIFPIMQTPFSASNALDVEALAKQVKFLARCGVHGMVWPQLASEWSELSREERIAGAEAILAAAKGLAPKVILGVQAADAEGAAAYARHAAKIGADGIIALPLADLKNADALAAYYSAIAKACGLPLFVQSIGDMSVEFVLRLAREIPSLRFVKDEAGHTLSRISEYRRLDRSVAVFTGGHGRSLLDELARGSSGTMPAASFADFYVKIWDLWQAGKRAQAMEAFGRVGLLITQVQAYGIPSLKYILERRGVFSNSLCRGRNAAAHFDGEARRAIDETFEFVRAAAK
jgi:4-hydroxy-tetrahydrodipicolinate synthase